MTFITHHRYHGKTMLNKEINLPYGSELELVKDALIAPNHEPVCIYRSEVAKQHFAINTDGKGLERGALTYAIAYSKRHMGRSGARFTDNELCIITTKWSRFIRPDCESLIFNDDFFMADVPTLRKLAEDVHIKAPR